MLQFILNLYFINLLIIKFLFLTLLSNFQNLYAIIEELNGLHLKFNEISRVFNFLLLDHYNLNLFISLMN